jgi:hypothetical protein
MLERDWKKAWPPRCLCYRPTVFFRHLYVITLLYRQEIFGVSLKNVIISGKFIFKDCARLVWRNLRAQLSMIICSDTGLCWVLYDLSIDKIYAMTNK